MKTCREIRKAVAKWTRKGSPTDVETIEQQSNEETTSPTSTAVYSIPPSIGTISPGVEEVTSSKKHDKKISMRIKIAQDCSKRLKISCIRQNINPAQMHNAEIAFF